MEFVAHMQTLRSESLRQPAIGRVKRMESTSATPQDNSSSNAKLESQARQVLLGNPIPGGNPVPGGKTPVPGGSHAHPQAPTPSREHYSEYPALKIIPEFNPENPNPGAVEENSSARQNTRGQESASTKQMEQGTPGDSNGLTPEEQQQVEQLKRRDAEVRRHEQAHASAGGAHAGTPQYDLKRGPDGRMYAVGGHVSVDTSPVSGDPDATIAKMRQVRAAAVAPAQPSAQDRRVAAKAQAAIVDAQMAKSEQLREARKSEEENGPGSPNAMDSVGQRRRAATVSYDTLSKMESSANSVENELNFVSCAKCGSAHAP